MLWSSIPKKQGHTKIDDRIKNYCYNWILQHTQVVKSPITNDLFKLFIDDHSRMQIAPKLL